MATGVLRVTLLVRYSWGSRMAGLGPSAILEMGAPGLGTQAVRLGRGELHATEGREEGAKGVLTSEVALGWVFQCHGSVWDPRSLPSPCSALGPSIMQGSMSHPVKGAATWVRRRVGGGGLVLSSPTAASWLLLWGWGGHLGIRDVWPLDTSLPHQVGTEKETVQKQGPEEGCKRCRGAAGGAARLG